MDSKNLADLYDLPTLEWEPFAAQLAGGYPQAPDTGGPNRHSTWLATIDADGSPHVNGIGSMWVDGAFVFETGRASRKGRNLERDPRCTLSLAMDTFDIVVEGEAELVTDPAVVADIARRYAEHGWPARVDDSGTALTAEFSAPSAGPPPWHVYRVVPRIATVLSTIEPGGATRFTF
jgi:pyridoxine/pyridoxamine 5'-phosphate oxidase